MSKAPGLTTGFVRVVHHEGRSGQWYVGRVIGEGGLASAALSLALARPGAG
jgi:hypothetical protein